MHTSFFGIIFYYTTFVVFLCFPNLSKADKETFYIYLTEQSLNSALIELGRQGNTSIIFSGQQLSGLAAPTVTGEMTIFQALQKLLVSSDLTAKIINNSVVAIVPKEESTEPIAQPSRMEELTIVGRKVTGSRLGVVGFESAAPVDLILRSDLELSGSYDVGDLLKSVPAVSGNSSSTAVSNGGNGTTTVTLRGLPANNTLVLMNGRRLASNGIYGGVTDLNSIPSAAIERIEILKDGASAVYGSDAIAGVVNVILREEFEGVQLEQYTGLSHRSDVETMVSELLLGKRVGPAALFLSFEHFQQDGLFSADRPLSASADKRAEGGTDLRSSATPLSRISLSDDNVYILDVDANPQASGANTSQFRLANSEDLYNYRESTSSISPSRRDTLYLSGLWDTQKNWSLKVDGSYTRTFSTIHYAPTPLSTGSEIGDLIVSRRNIYNPFGEDIHDVRRRLLEMGGREQSNGADIARINMGFTFEEDTSKWTLDALWNDARADETFSNVLDFNKTLRALGPSSSCLGKDIDGCVPLNLFGPIGSITQDQITYLRSQATIKGRSSLMALNGNVETLLFQLPAGPMRMAAGFEMRSESIASTASKNNDNLISGSLNAASRGERQVAEIYSEVRVPMASQRAYIKSLDAELAIRYSDYSDFGQSLTPKLSFLYRPTENVLFRSTLSKGFRAPNLGELHKGKQTSFVFLSDPCAQDQAVETFLGCDLASDPTQNQFLTTFEGEPDLEAEQSDSYTLGVVWSHKAQGLNLSLDYFHISQRNVVDANAQYILDQNAHFGLLSELVERDDSGNIQRLFAPFINIGHREVSGLDSNIRWLKTTPTMGKFIYSLNASYLQKFIDQITSTSSRTDVSGTFVDAASEGNGALPRWKANMGLMWQKNRLHLNYSVHYISSLTERLRGTDTIRKISPWLSHDMQMDYRLHNSGLGFSLGMNNIWDSEPPLIASALNDSYDARSYDLIGRFFYGKIRYEFD